MPILGPIAASLSNDLAYFSGGRTSGSTIPSESEIERLDCNTETISILGNTFSPVYSQMGVSQFRVKGFIAGGSSYTTAFSLNTIEKLSFTTETKTLLTATLPQTRTRGAATSDKFIGGNVGSSSSIASSVVKMSFDLETASTESYTLNIARNYACAISSRTPYVNYPTSPTAYAYCAGGMGVSGEPLSSIERTNLDSPVPNWNTLSIQLSLNAHKQAGLQNPGVAGYFCGGTNMEWVPTLGDYIYYDIESIDKLGFVTQTITNLPSMLSQGVSDMSSASRTSACGYLVGGAPAGLSVTSSSNLIRKFSFPTETATTLSIVLTKAKRSMASLTNSTR